MESNTTIEDSKLEIPQDKEERDWMRSAVRQHVREGNLVPPLSMEELQEHARTIVSTLKIAEDYKGFITVLIGNEVWRETLASVPYERRVLLLPQCLRANSSCPAEIDEFGLLCEECGSCPIGGLQSEAEKLGYVVLVAEGTTVVTKLLERGKVDAVVGVSCLSVLERSFPHMASHAIPGVAIPLLKNGCVDTELDVDWIDEAIHLRSPGKWSGREDLDNLREEVDSWFDVTVLKAVLQHDGTTTERISTSWLAKAGKRWRPFLSACVFRALNGTETDMPEGMKKLAVAVECFHKASLVHDDIEDNDDVRYGQMTLHRQHGMPIALNVGDLLIGEGYRLITDSGAAPEQLVRMLSVAADGHRTLCLGQGEELSWIREPMPLTASHVLDIFRRKTAPAFEVALQIGAIYGGADDGVRKVLTTFSESLGIAYQIRDDLKDFLQDHGNGSGRAIRPSLLMALAYEHSDETKKRKIASLWRREPGEKGRTRGIRDFIGAAPAEEKAKQLLEHYKNEAIRSLASLRNAHLKGLLRRIVTTILDGE